jgi:hypothetical protein
MKILKFLLSSVRGKGDVFWDEIYGKEYSLPYLSLSLLLLLLLMLLLLESLLETYIPHPFNLKLTN